MACKIFLELSTGVKIPALGYGTWQADDEQVLTESLEVALNSGYRHIDTAFAYLNEHVIGNVLKKLFNSGKLKREDVFVTTKLGPTTAYPDKVEESLKNSLEKLQLDYVDLYLIHFPLTLVVEPGREPYGHPDIHYLDIWKKMEEEYKAGRAKAIGLSNFNKAQVEDVLKNCTIKPACNQIELHAYMQQADLVDFCKKNGVAVVAYSPLGSRGYNDFLKKICGPDVQHRDIPDLFANPIVQKIGIKHSKTPAQILLRFLLQIGVAAIPKSTTPERIKENINIFDFVLDDNDMSELKGLEVGTSVRICNFKVFGDVVAQHANFPF